MWRKSTYSDGNDDSACVEVAFADQVGIRDSKNPDSELTFPATSFHEFVALACQHDEVPGR